MRLRIQQSGPKSLNDAIRFSIKIEAFVEQDDKKEGMWDMPKMQATTKWHMNHTQIKMSGKSYGIWHTGISLKFGNVVLAKEVQISAISSILTDTTFLSNVTTVVEKAIR